MAQSKHIYGGVSRELKIGRVIAEETFGMVAGHLVGFEGKAWAETGHLDDDRLTEILVYGTLDTDPDAEVRVVIVTH